MLNGFCTRPSVGGLRMNRGVASLLFAIMLPFAVVMGGCGGSAGGATLAPDPARPGDALRDRGLAVRAGGVSRP
jgi:hypothetical protein